MTAPGVRFPALARDEMNDEQREVFDRLAASPRAYRLLEDVPAEIEYCDSIHERCLIRDKKRKCTRSKTENKINNDSLMLIQSR